MAFKLKSGNTTSFKGMGSSPVKQTYTVTRSQSVIDEEKKAIEAKKKAQEKVQQQIDRTYVETEEESKEKLEEYHPRKKSPAKQSRDWSPAYEGGDHSFEDLRKMGPKKIKSMFPYTHEKILLDLSKHENKTKAQKRQVADDFESTYESGDESKKKSPNKQTDTTYADGTKKSKREQDFAERYTAEKAKDKYWYKINNKAATKAQYMAYKNKPGGDEPGKQTNDPTVSLARQSANKRKQK